jgi:hypothetical protein
VCFSFSFLMQETARDAPAAIFIIIYIKEKDSTADNWTQDPNKTARETKLKLSVQVQDTIEEELVLLQSVGFCCASSHFRQLQ